MQIFRSGIKGNSRKRAEWGVELGVSVGVEETKGDKRKTAKSEEDKEGERECRGAQIKEPATKCSKDKAAEN